MRDKKKFVIFAHSGTYDKLYQIITLAITAASSGRETHIFLFFWALKKFVNEEFDVTRLSFEFGEEGECLAKHMQKLNPVSLKEIFQEVRGLGNLKVYACTAAVKLMGLDETVVKSKVDDILGLTTLLEIAEGAETQLFI
ncbi:MAG: DsrE/DsrF/DrsH-like family protein [Candidatus Brocadiaceae bacterium]|nr:DsrE/DsrF/DrsH-like family protein [Candidatus Brocadiaceae bacterium]